MNTSIIVAGFHTIPKVYSMKSKPRPSNYHAIEASPLDYSEHICTPWIMLPKKEPRQDSPVG